MVSKVILSLLLLVAAFSQITAPSTTPSALSVIRLPPTTFPSGPSGPSGPSSGTNSPGNGDVDIDDSQAGSLIQSLFGNNPAAAQSLRLSSSPAPSSAPAGAVLSSSAPTSAQRASASPGLSTSALSYYPGYPGYPGYPTNFNWGRWVRVLRCNFNNYGGGFCCRYVWVWRYW